MLRGVATGNIAHFLVVGKLVVLVRRGQVCLSWQLGRHLGRLMGWEVVGSTPFALLSEGWLL